MFITLIINLTVIQLGSLLHRVPYWIYHIWHNFTHTHHIEIRHNINPKTYSIWFQHFSLWTVTILSSSTIGIFHDHISVIKYHHRQKSNQFCHAPGAIESLHWTETWQFVFWIIFPHDWKLTRWSYSWIVVRTTISMKTIILTDLSKPYCLYWRWRRMAQATSGWTN